MKSFKLVDYGLLLALLIGTHTAVYMKGRGDVEAKYAEANIEQLEEDVQENSERIERQVTGLAQATARITSQAARVEEAINDNAEVNLDPNCSLSDDELREFNALIAETDRSVPGEGVGALSRLKSAIGNKSRRTEEGDE
jgi:hypothetical protein